MSVAPRLVWRVAEVVEIKTETPRVVTLRLNVADWPGHRAGQHVDVRLTAEDGYQAQRSYSISSPPEASLVDLTVETIEQGEVSPYLTREIRVGDRFELRGPIGGFFVWSGAKPSPLVLIGGGSGVAPLMAMLRHRATIESKPPATLIYSSRSFEEIIFREELERLAQIDSTLRVVHTLTRSHPPDWKGFVRRIDRPMLHDAAELARSDAANFICGPSGLVETAAQTLVALGVPAARIRTERFGPSGT